ncbi:MAG: DUF2255 domain-containing protein [Acidobacteriia bacterium]|nr:DUF2255 domain-containing protein [Terriglobia bacterium]
MTKRSDTLADRLSRSSEITISVTGRNSGRTISRPVWFVSEDDKLYTVTVLHSTQTVPGKAPASAPSSPNHKAREAVSSVIEKFRAKYGASDVKKYYSKFDVAVLAQTR